MSTKAENLFPGRFKIQWSETMHMLDLSANQIDLTVLEGNESMELLMTTFTTLKDHLQKLEKMLNGHGGNPPASHIDNILQHCGRTKEIVNQSVIGLQFYDRFTQRLHNIRESIAVLAALIDDPERHNVPEEWILLRDKIRSKYSIEQQKTIFHALMQGTDIDEVFELFDND
ncbi:MAG: hypothetical protein JXA04_10050 [Gammaproteobacteria bacterium]|nr:hypothetical protein [Gammaproteobacteria bacterium]